jgi:squalene-hopene/tetraprenyl-beta-curcumene cyclase
MALRIALFIVFAAVPGFAQDWSPQLAAEYLDSRQKAWFEWPEARARPNGPCLSCHTGMTYLLARPVLRRALSEGEPTTYETGLIDALRTRVEKNHAEALSKKSSAPLAVEAILAALFLRSQMAFDQLWALQSREGKTSGAWPWYDLNLDPWETPYSPFYAAALAAVAAGNLRVEQRSEPEVQTRIQALAEYLQREQAGQPLHNRLALVWASSKLPGLVHESARRAIIDEALGKQQTDGGWTLESLGPWAVHPDAAPSTGSNSYATAFAVFALRQAGAGSDARVVKAVDWLKANQNRQFGFWPAESMNKQYSPDSMPKRFMQDAATAFAVLALLDGR